MSSLLKFVGVALFTIISLSLMATRVLGIYPSIPGWMQSKGLSWLSPKPPVIKPVATRATTEDTERFDIEGGDVIISSKVDEKKLGAPIYPGSEKQGAGSVVYSDATSGSEEITGARFTTSDPFEKVVHFYQPLVKQGAHLDMSSGDDKQSAILSLSSDDGKDTMGIYIIRKKESPTTEIAIHRGIARPGRPAMP